MIVILTMRRRISYLLLCTLFFLKCANRGTASGGIKDIIPPVVIKEEPQNFSINFSSDEIKIYFDEYIKLKNLQKQLIISPPMDPQPEITPMGSASKIITIKIYDTLQPNSTYAFNFGNSIEDNNEGNTFPFYRYVFSTGPTIDSLSVSGLISDALELETSEEISVHLHEIDSTYNDSIIFKQKPKYIGLTDSLSKFIINNIKAGQYLLTALEEENINYTFQQKKDKIAFRSKFVTIPSDTAYVLKLFKQRPEFKFIRARQLAQGRIGFGYEGDPSSMQIKGISDVFDSLAIITSKEPNKDTLNLWIRPRELKVDSLLFEVLNKEKKDTVNVRTSKMKNDSLTFSALSTSLKLGNLFKISSSIPIIEVDPSKTIIIDQDSIYIDSHLSIDELTNTQINLKFDLNEDNRYKVIFMPGAFMDFYGNQNDTLNFNANTKKLSSYGNLRLNLNNATYPLIVQIISANGKVKYGKIINESKPVDFINLDPGEYFIRAIFDLNNNGRYDAGNYLKKVQPERVSYAKEILEIRAGWDSVEDFFLED